MVAVKKPKAPSQKKILEKQITAQVKNYLELRGWRAIRFQRTVMSGSFQTGESGQADYLFVKYDTELLHPPGSSRCLWLEMKAPSGHLGPKQEEWIERERKRGGLVMVVDDLHEFIRYYERTFGVSGQMRML